MASHGNEISLQLFALDDFLTLLCWHFTRLNRSHGKLVKSPGGEGGGGRGGGLPYEKDMGAR